VASKKPSDSTSVFLAHLIVLVVLLVVFTFSFMAYVDTLWMKAEIKKEAKELRKLKEELKKELK
jgi:flagellar biosynthesis protein FlhB